MKRFFRWVKKTFFEFPEDMTAEDIENAFNEADK